MRRNEFLTRIARGHSVKIGAVFYCRLNGATGKIFKWKDDDSGSLFIDINEEKLICPYQILYVLYHEVGHIILGHCDRACKLAIATREKQADMWAFREMGLLGSEGKTNKELAVCHACIKSLSRTCLRDLAFHKETTAAIDGVNANMLVA